MSTYIETKCTHMLDMEKLRQDCAFDINDNVIQRERPNITKMHCERVAEYLVRASIKEGITNRIGAEKIFIAGYYHDIGKVDIPNEVLDSKKIFTPQDREYIKMHAVHGVNRIYRMQNEMDPETIELALSMVINHHRNVDGTQGYPSDEFLSEKLDPQVNTWKNNVMQSAQLRFGEDLIKLNHIIAIVDSFDAIREARQYKHGKSTAKTLEILENDMKKNPSLYNAKLFENIKNDPDVLHLSRNYSITKQKNATRDVAVQNYRLFLDYWTTEISSIDSDFNNAGDFEKPLIEEKKNECVKEMHSECNWLKSQHYNLGISFDDSCIKNLMSMFSLSVV